MKNEDIDIKYMRQALRQAHLARRLGEVPIGCVIVFNGLPIAHSDENTGMGGDMTRKVALNGIEPGTVVGRGYNRRNTDKSALCHAEITAIRKACKKLGDWRLEGCTMYVTLEPCQMCAGAIVQARIPKVVMACMNPKAGCAGSVMNILDHPQFNHQVEIESGVLEEECSLLLKEFFTSLRKRKKNKPEMEQT